MDDEQKEILALVNDIQSARSNIGWVIFKANEVDAKLCSIRKRFKEIIGEEAMAEKEPAEAIRMEEDYVFGYRINEQVVREIVLDKKEKSLLMNGLNYAREKDSIEDRKKEYRALMTKLNVVIGGSHKRKI